MIMSADIKVDKTKEKKPLSQIIRELNEFLFYGKMWDISDKQDHECRHNSK